MTRQVRWGCIALVMLACGASACATAGPVVVLVRHAEKADDGKDPPLTDAGHARAKALVRLLERTGVDAIYSSEYIRTQSTVAPLAEAVGIRTEVVPAREPEALLDKLRQHAPDDVVVVAGHSNTVPGIMKAMGATAPPAIDHHEYDRIFVVTMRPSGPPIVVELAFGERSELPTADSPGEEVAPLPATGTITTVPSAADPAPEGVAPSSNPEAAPEDEDADVGAEDAANG